MAASALSDARISLLSPLVPATDPTSATSPSPSAGAQWDKVLDELLRLRDLPDDWDGQGSRAVDPANAASAIAWVRDMRRWQRAVPPTTVLPGTTGEIVLEWRGDSFYLAAEISKPSQVEWLLNVPGQPVKQWDTDLRSTWIVCAER